MAEYDEESLEEDGLKEEGEEAEEEEEDDDEEDEDETELPEEFGSADQDVDHNIFPSAPADGADEA